MANPRSSGRWQKGQSGNAAGNPCFAAEIARLRKVIFDGVKNNEQKEIVKNLITQAKNPDIKISLPAVEVLWGYCGLRWRDAKLDEAPDAPLIDTEAERKKLTED